MKYCVTLLRREHSKHLPNWTTSLGIVVLICALGGGVMAEGGSEIPDATVEMEQEAELSPAEQTAWADRQLEDMQQLARRIQGMLDQARQEQDIIKERCLDAKLAELNATIRSFESVRQRHATAVQNRNDELRNHNFRMLYIMTERVRSMRVEAEGCVGGPEVTFGRTEVTTEVDPSITTDDPSLIPVDQILFDRPPSGSGY